MMISDRHRAILEHLRADPGISVKALAAILCDPELEIIPIIGGKTPGQIADSMKSLEIKLTKNQISQIMKG